MQRMDVLEIGKANTHFLDGPDVAHQNTRRMGNLEMGNQDPVLMTRSYEWMRISE